MGNEEIVNDKKKIGKAMDEHRGEAEILLKDPDKMEIILQRLEKKLKNIPLVGDKLSCVPTLISLVRSYIKKEYTDIPLGTVISIVSALLYFLSPIDLIPDFLPGVGYLDDVAVIALCWKLVVSDIEEYLAWREKNNRSLID